jgi:hypothetical protein
MSTAWTAISKQQQVKQMIAPAECASRCLLSNFRCYDESNR